MVGAGPGSVVGKPWRVRFYDQRRSINQKKGPLLIITIMGCQSVKDEPLVSLWLHIHIASVAPSRHALAWEHLSFHSHTANIGGPWVIWENTELDGLAKDLKLQKTTQAQLICLQCVNCFEFLWSQSWLKRSFRCSGRAWVCANFWRAFCVLSQGVW